MSESSVNIKQLESPSKLHKQEIGTTCKNELIAMAIHELEWCLAEQIEKIKILVQGCATVNKGYYSRGQHNSVGGHTVCKFCGSRLWENKPANIKLDQVLTNQVKKDSHSQFAQMLQNQVESFDQTSSSGNLEKKPWGMDNWNINHSGSSSENMMQRSDFPKRKPLTIARNRKMWENQASQNTATEHSYNSEQTMEKELSVDAQTEETNQDTNSEILIVDENESPWMKPILRDMQWSDYLEHGEEKTSDESITLLEGGEMKVDEPDLHSTGLKKLAQPEVKLRGRPIHRCGCGIGSRKSEELTNPRTGNGARISQERSEAARKSVRAPGHEDDCSLNQRNVVISTNVSALLEISDTETTDLESTTSNRDVINLP